MNLQKRVAKLPIEMLNSPDGTQHDTLIGHWRQSKNAPKNETFFVRQLAMIEAITQ